MRNQITKYSSNNFAKERLASLVAMLVCCFSAVFAQAPREVLLSATPVITLCSERSESMDSIQVSVTNIGVENVSSLKLGTYIDGVFGGSFNWTGNISSVQNDLLSLPIQLNPNTDSTYLSIVTEKVNGSEQFTKDTIEIIIRSGVGSKLNLPEFQYFCLGQSASIDAGQGYESYQWGNGDTTTKFTLQHPGDYDITVVDEFGCIHKDTVKARLFDYPASIVPSSLNFCENEGANLSVDSNFSFVSWSSGTNHSTLHLTESGLYQVTVTDSNGCSYTAATQAQKLSSPSSILSEREEACENENLQLDAGDFPEVIWQGHDSSRVFYPTSSGVYHVDIIGQNGCATNDSVVVEIYPSPSISIIGDSVLCNNTSLTLGTDGSIGDYSWNTQNVVGNELEVSSPGVYEVQVIDTNGCLATDQLRVSQENVSLSTSSDTVLCEGDAIQLSALTEVDNTIFWPNGMNGNTIQISESGEYVVRATSAHCEVEKSIRVEQLFAPSSEFDVELVDNQVSLTHLGDYGESFIWDFGDNNFSAEENPSHTFTNIGDFDITLTTKNICGISTNMVTVQVGSLGINELTNEGMLSVYPNPVNSDHFNVEINNWSGDVSFGLYDNLGRLVYQQESYITGFAMLQVPVSSLGSGVYLFVVELPNQRVVEKLLID